MTETRRASAFVRVRPVFAALVDATCPSDGLDEERKARVLDGVEALVDALNPTTRNAVVLGAGVLDRVTGPGRFSRLDGPAGRARLDALARRRPRVWRLLRLLRDIVVVAYYEQPAVRSAVGYDPDPFIAAQARRRLEEHGDDIAAHRQLLVDAAPLLATERTAGSRPRGAIRSAQEMHAPVECDAVVVGSGAGGAVVAAELAEAGLAVVVLEEGGHHPTETFTTTTTDALRRLYRDAGASTTLGPTPVGWSEGRCVGGSTVVNGGMAFRGSERVLDGWARRAGTHQLDAEHLAHYYERVERFLSVGPPDPASIGRDQELLRAGAERLGWRVIDDTRAHVHCTGCNVCTWGCPTGAKQSTLVSYLPRAVHFGADVWSNCRVRRVLFRGKRAVGVEAVVAGEGQRRVEVHAERVVVACGAVQTPALLQRSGVRQTSGVIGRHLYLHPGASVVAAFDEVVDGWKGAHQSYQVREFEREGFVLAAVNLPPSLVARSLPHLGDDLGREMAHYPNMVTAGVLVEDTHSGRVRSVGNDALVTYRLTEHDAERVVRATSLLCEALFEAGARRIHLPFDGRPTVSDPGELRQLTAVPVRPGAIAASTVHLMGTARLGTDPLTAACDPMGAVYDTAGLFVADASLFPAPLGVNPMLTIMALATRVAAGIIQGWNPS